MDKIREGIWGNEQSTMTYMENYHKKPTVLFAKKNKSIRSHVMAHTHSLSTKVAKAERLNSETFWAVSQWACFGKIIKKYRYINNQNDYI